MDRRLAYGTDCRSFPGQRAIVFLSQHRGGAIAVAVAFTLLAVSFLPLETESGTYICHDCGLRQTHRSRYLLGRNLGKSTIEDTQISSMYDQHIAIPHHHDWIRGPRSFNSKSFWSESRGCGSTPGGRWPARQEWITQEAVFEVATTYKDLPRETRRMIYKELVGCPTYDAYLVQEMSMKARFGQAVEEQRSRQDSNLRPAD